MVTRGTIYALNLATRATVWNRGTGSSFTKKLRGMNTTSSYG